MNKAILLAIAVMLAVQAGKACAKDILLTCSLPAGARLTLAINRRQILQSGHAMKNLDPKSIALGKRYIAFNQSFNTYTNAWTIDRNTLKYSVKTILKPGSRIVIDEKGSCANAAAKSRPRGHTAASLWPR